MNIISSNLLNTIFIVQLCDVYKTVHQDWAEISFQLVAQNDRYLWDRWKLWAGVVSVQYFGWRNIYPAPVIKYCVYSTATTVNWVTKRPLFMSVLSSSEFMNFWNVQFSLFLTGPLSVCLKWWCFLQLAMVFHCMWANFRAALPHITKCCSCYSYLACSGS